MKRSTKRKQEPSPPRASPSPPPINLRPPAYPTPPNGPAAPPIHLFPLLSRYRLPIFLTLSVAAAAFAYSEYRRHERQIDGLPSSPAAASSGLSTAPAPASPASSLSGRCPVLVSSAPSVIAANPVLQRIGRYGLPALPYVDREAAYAYPLLVKESYVSQYNTRTRNANWVIEILNAASAPHAAAPAAALSPSSASSALPASSFASAATLPLPDAASQTPPAPSTLSRSASAPAVGSSSSSPPSSPCSLALPRVSSPPFTQTQRCCRPPLLPLPPPSRPLPSTAGIWSPPRTAGRVSARWTTASC